MDLGDTAAMIAPRALVVESGDKPKDDEAVAILKGELARAEKTLKLPDIEADKDGPKLLAELPLKVTFVKVRSLCQLLIPPPTTAWFPEKVTFARTGLLL